MEQEPREVRAAQALVQLVLERLEDIAARLIEENTRLVSGERLAREVAAFYRGLVEAGVPEDLARSLTTRYLERLLALASPTADILAAIMGAGRNRVQVISLQGLREAMEAYKAAQGAMGGHGQAEDNA